MRQVKKLHGRRVELLEDRIRELERMELEQQKKLNSYEELKNEAEAAKKLRSELEVKEA